MGANETLELRLQSRAALTRTIDAPWLFFEEYANTIQAAIATAYGFTSKEQMPEEFDSYWYQAEHMFGFFTARPVKGKEIFSCKLSLSGKLLPEGPTFLKELLKSSVLCGYEEEQSEKRGYLINFKSDYHSGTGITLLEQWGLDPAELCLITEANPWTWTYVNLQHRDLELPGLFDEDQS